MENRFGTHCDGLAGEGRVVGVQKFYSWGKCIIHAINEYQLRLDVQHFLWSSVLFILYYAGPLFCILGCHINLVEKGMVWPGFVK